MESRTIDKVGLAVIREGKLLLVRNAGTEKLLLPGGRREGHEIDTEVLAREIKEELACEVTMTSLAYIGLYHDVAANDPGQAVEIRLYRGEIVGNIVPSAEVAEVVWFNPLQDDALRLSQIIRRQIVPSLTAQGLLGIR